MGGVEDLVDPVTENLRFDELAEHLRSDPVRVVDQRQQQVLGPDALLFAPARMPLRCR